MVRNLLLRVLVKIWKSVNSYDKKNLLANTSGPSYVYAILVDLDLVPLGRRNDSRHCCMSGLQKLMGVTSGSRPHHCQVFDVGRLPMWPLSPIYCIIGGSDVAEWTALTQWCREWDLSASCAFASPTYLRHHRRLLLSQSYQLRSRLYGYKGTLKMNNDRKMRDQILELKFRLTTTKEADGAVSVWVDSKDWTAKQHV